MGWQEGIPFTGDGISTRTGGSVPPHPFLWDESSPWDWAMEQSQHRELCTRVRLPPPTRGIFTNPSSQESFAMTE